MSLISIKKILLHDSHREKLIMLGYICIFVFFLSFSPIFYAVDEKRFLFELDLESFIVLTIFCIVLIASIIWFGRQKKNSTILNNALSEYVAKDVTQELLSQKWKVNLNWERKKVSIFFSDIEWFTSISDAFTPEELVLFLKEYFWIMTSNIQKYDWYVDKYEWDCIMAIWWAFHTMQKDSYNTCLSAIKQQKALKILNIKLKKTLWKALKVRMWINTWEAVLGNIWAPGKKLEFTALWNSVNLASRLEWVNRIYGTYICVSQSVYEECLDFFEFRELDNVIVKWKKTPLKVYELIDEAGKVDDNDLEMYKEYNKWLVLYYEKNYEKAREIFQNQEDIDLPSYAMAKKCTEILEK